MAPCAAATASFRASSAAWRRRLRQRGFQPLGCLGHRKRTDARAEPFSICATARVGRQTGELVEQPRRLRHEHGQHLALQRRIPQRHPRKMLKSIGPSSGASGGETIHSIRSR